jgi:DNA-binding transcriptional LysR family regulator
MDIRALRYAVTLAEELHFGRAAQRHYISAQPFGRHIQRLERELGTKLFERTSRRVVLTPDGARLIAEAQALLDTVDSLAEQQRHDTPDGRLLTLGVLGFGLAERWPDLIQALHSQDPGITFSHADLDLADQYDAVRGHRIDVGIVQYVGPVDGLVFERVLSTPRVVGVPPPPPVSDSPWLPTALAHPALEAWSGPAADGSHSRNALRNPAAIPAAVATTGRLALHAHAASRFYPRPDVSFVPLEGPPVEIAIATRATDNRPAIAAVRHAARLLNTPQPFQPG